MILITGGTGNSGSEIVNALAATGTRFRALSRKPEKDASLRLPGVEVVQGDLADPPSLARALAGVDRLLMLAPPVPNRLDQLQSPLVLGRCCLVFDKNGEGSGVLFMKARQGHGIDEPRLQMDLNRRTAAWLDRWIRGTESERLDSSPG